MTQYLMSTNGPSIFYITLDSVRMDHTSLSGYERDTTPNIAELADSPQGVSFDHCIAHGIRTPVSAPSMLTGLVPSRHQIGLGQSGETLGRVPDSMKTAQELFGNSGYDTIGVSDNRVIEATGLNKTFEQYENVPMMFSELLEYPTVLSGIKYVFDIWEHGPGAAASRSEHGEQTSFFLNDISKRTLKHQSKKSGTVFCYLHYNDTHNPYLPPSSWIDEYLDESTLGPKRARSLARTLHADKNKLIAEGLPLSDVEWETIGSMYDATLKYVDSTVGSMVEFIKHRFDDPIIVITADHGDLLGEGGLLDHEVSIRDELIHVPLVVWGLPELEQVSDGVVQHSDVLKTLLSAVGADSSQVQGYNLLESKREFAVSQAHHHSVANGNAEDYGLFKRHNPEFDDSSLPHSLLTSVRTTDFKLYHSDDQSKLYELPDESTEVKTKYPELRDRLSEFAEQWLDEEGTVFEKSPDRAEMGEGTRRQLEAMGYVSRD